MNKDPRDTTEVSTVEEPESQRRTGTRSPRVGVGEAKAPPMMIGRGTKAREMHDGAGLCSPGRWPPEQRKLPENAVLTELQTLLKRYVARHFGSDLFARLACGKVKECPFEAIEHLREELYRLYERQEEEPRKREQESSEFSCGTLAIQNMTHQVLLLECGWASASRCHAYRLCTRANGAGDSGSKKIRTTKSSSQQWKNSWNSRYTKGKR